MQEKIVAGNGVRGCDGRRGQVASWSQRNSGIFALDRREGMDADWRQNLNCDLRRSSRAAH